MSKQHDYLRAIEKISDTKRREQLDADEATMFESRYYKHNTTGAIEKVNTQERADALEKNTDWKRFYYTLQETSISEQPLAKGFKDKLKEEIERLDEDMQEIDEEISRLAENRKEMYEKRQEFAGMLYGYQEFTEKYPELVG